MSDFGALAEAAAGGDEAALGAMWDALEEAPDWLRADLLLHLARGYARDASRRAVEGAAILRRPQDATCVSIETAVSARDIESARAGGGWASVQALLAGRRQEAAIRLAGGTAAATANHERWVGLRVTHGATRWDGGRVAAVLLPTRVEAAPLWLDEGMVWHVGAGAGPVSLPAGQ